MQYNLMDFRFTLKLLVQFSKITEKDLHEITEKAKPHEGLDLVAPRTSENSKTRHMNNVHSVECEDNCQLLTTKYVGGSSLCQLK
jgi:hypothetical protein